MKALTRRNLLIALSEDFVSYLLTERFSEKYEIRNIILYGSVVRGDYTDKSDIDIFIDVLKPRKDLEKTIKQSVEDFYNSVWFKKWKRLGISNKIACLVGDLKEWKDLHRSIVVNNILLYGTYTHKMGGKMMTMFTVENIKPNTKRVFILRKIFGYKRYGKKYEGLLDKYGGIRIGKGCFLIPIGYSKDVLNLLRREKINVKMREITLIG